MNATYADDCAGATEEIPCTGGEEPENSDATGDAPRDSNEEAEVTVEPTPAINTPMPSLPVGCSTERTVQRPVRDNTATPAGPTKRKGFILLGVDREEKKGISSSLKNQLSVDLIELKQQSA